MEKKYIAREKYLNKIIPFVNKNIIKVISGQRRVGKSYFIFQLIDYVKENYPEGQIIYINKELHEFNDIKTAEDLVKYVNKDLKIKQKIFLFIDEIQEIKSFEKAIRNFQALGNYDIYCTGSNANMLSGDLATYLSGRYIEIKIFALSYLEFLRFHSLQNNKTSLFNYIKYGGLPYLIHLPLEDGIVYEYLINIYNTVLLKDVVKRYAIRNIYFLEQLIHFLGDNIGNLVSAKKVSDYLKSQKVKISPNIVLNYLSYLVSAYLIVQVQRSDISGKKIFEIGEKYYFEDLGIRNTIVGYLQKDIGKILENLVFIRLIQDGFAVTVGKMNNKEIDFVCDKKNERLYIQVAYMIPDEKTYEREFGNLLAIPDNYKKIVISMDDMIGGSYKGIEHLHVLDFLTHF
ncbi:MAG: ATPase, ATPase (AAA+ superfamily) [Candidatus Magnetoglobus multicellularis str. Araruama]|uniref:ATPase, ATPase (AAA+ superfamily) n=1 Tax=Candidatus Magnetoglobus multicellularis str. Araruama TaxID=890399 RepID=A0A1V1P4P3_9BACT|nr:MAG: ATPase, ATPase (AAA+ superfamily) [Candidatus Magnetoglobus multicellularis str. Araruama]